MRRSALLFCLFLLTGHIYGQSSLVWSNLEIQRASDGSAVIIGVVRSQSKKIQALSYALQLKKVGPTGNVMTTQSGSFTLEPDEEKALSKVSINLGETAGFEINFKVFDDERIVTTRQMKSDEAFIQKFRALQPLPKQSIAKQEEQKVTAQKQKKRNAVDALEIDGLILDETRSKTGRDFYDIFYTKWTAPAEARDFSITIRELPSRGRSARIAVEVNGNILFSRFLQPRQDVLELLAEQTVIVIQKHLNDSEKLKNDLEADDQKGSGIF